jgi:PAS domain S-box-containing protein
MALSLKELPLERPADASDPAARLIALDGLLRLFVEQWPGAVLLFDGDAQLLWWNRQAHDELPAPEVLRPGIAANRLFAHWELGEHWDRYRAAAAPLLLPRIALRASCEPRRSAQLRLQPLLHGGQLLATACIVDLQPLHTQQSLSPPSSVVLMDDGADDEQSMLRRLETAVLTVRGGVWEWRADEGRAILSAGYFQLLGLEPQPGAEQVDVWSRHIHPDDKAEVHRLALAHMNDMDDNTFEHEYRMRHADGRWLWVLDRGRITARDAHGRVAVVTGMMVDITARRLAEAALRDSETRFRVATEVASGLIYEVNLAEDITVRHGLERLTGYTQQEVPQTFEGWLDVVVEEDRDRLRQAVYAYRKACTSYDLQYRLRSKDGRILHMWHRGGFALDAEGKSTRGYGFVEDVTARVQTEQALRASEFRFRAVAELTSGYIFESRLSTDGANSIMFVSDSFVQVMGVAHDEFLRRGGWDAFCDPPSLLQFRSGLERLEAGFATDIEVHGCNLLGAEKWLRLRSTPLRDPVTGACIGSIGAATDHTEAKLADLALRQQAHIIATLREGVAVIDGQGRVCLSNAAFDRMFGYATGELQGRFSGELSTLSPALYQKMGRRIHEQLENIEFEPTEFEALRKDGSRFTATCAVARIEVGGERRIVAVLSDVTEHKRLEREILQIANREQQRIGSDLHDGLGQDLTGVALLLRSLAARLARAQDVALREDLEPEVEQIIALVNDAIDSTRSLARGLSPVAAQRDGLVLGLEALVSQTCERYGVNVLLRQEVAETTDDHPLFDDATATHLYRIAQEAVVNAVRHGKARHITIALIACEESIRLSVEDDGSGFAVRAAQGSGMGLKIMRYRARMIGADLRIDSVPGGGTTIRCHCAGASA